MRTKHNHSDCSILLGVSYTVHVLLLVTDRYENRPSREEDVRRIRKLEANAIESRNAEVRAREEMAFFKRELLNREENYNKKFNANPVVGVMQVWEAHQTNICLSRHADQPVHPPGVPRKPLHWTLVFFLLKLRPNLFRSSLQVLDLAVNIGAADFNSMI